jgi:hypothetical protein
MLASVRPEYSRISVASLSVITRLRSAAVRMLAKQAVDMTCIKVILRIIGVNALL